MLHDDLGTARRVVLLGASAGGVEAISTVVAGLPADLPAAVLVVLHVPAWGTSVLPDILGRAGLLPVQHAVDGEPLLAARVYVAPPDRHLVTEDGVVRLTLGPKENGVRPAVDTLFRSAAHTHGPNVVAVVLSGTLDDGTAGLVAVKSHGGVTVAQDPADAAFPGMPDSAVRFARPAHVAPVRDIAALVSKCVRANADADQAGRDQASRQDERMDDPDELDELDGLDGLDGLDREHAAAADQEGVPSELNCPECGGTLWEREEGGLLRFRCRVGHAYSPESLFSDQLESLEGALWTAVVALQERGDLAMRLANRMTGRGQRERALRYEHQAADARRRADQVRTAILQLSRSGDHLEHAARAAAPPSARNA